MTFVLKKFVSQFFMPMPLFCETFLLGWLLRRYTRYKKTGAALGWLSVVFFLVFGYGLGRHYLYRLERRFSPFDPDSEQCASLCGVPIVILGQGMAINSDLPVRYQNNPVFERRLFEGIRVAKLIPESRVVVSMAGQASDTVKHEFIAFYLSQLGFPTNRLVMFTEARDTTEEASQAWRRISSLANRTQPESEGKIVSAQKVAHSITNKVVLLVTSASHIPRAMTIFHRQGFSPVAVPCDYTVISKSKRSVSWTMLPFPSGGDFEAMKTVLHEWLGGLYESVVNAP